MTDILVQVGTRFHRYWLEALDRAPQFAAGVLILIAFVFLSRAIRKIAARSSTLAAVEPDTAEIIGAIIHVAVIALGIVTALGTMGVDVGGMIAGLGLTGFALGFALKDILSNIVGGLLVLIYRPFERFDTITVSGQTGRVREINLRYTKIQDAEGQMILIPNSKLFSEIIRVGAEPRPTPHASAKPSTLAPRPTPVGGMTAPTSTSVGNPPPPV